MNSNKQNGFSALHIILLFLVLSCVAVSGYLVYYRNKDDSKDTINTPQIAETQETPKEKISESTDKPQEYTIEENENFKFSYPSNWLVGGSSEIVCLFSPEASITPSPRSCDSQSPKGFTSISIRYSSVGYAVKSIEDVVVYNGVYFTGINTTKSGNTAYEFDIKPEVQNGNIIGKLIRIAYPDNSDAWVEIDYKYIGSSVDYLAVFEEIVNSLELLSSEDVRGIGG